VLTEWDVTGANEANVRQNDTSMFRTWEVAGTSRVDQHLRDSREPLELRDDGISSEATTLDPPPPVGCNVKPVGTRVPTTYVLTSTVQQEVDGGARLCTIGSVAVSLQTWLRRAARVTRSHRA
jgi:hypothetical protein